MAAPLLLKAIPILRFRLQSSRLAAGILTRRLFCTAAELTRPPEEDLSSTGQNAAFLITKDPPKYPRCDDLDYQKWTDKEDESVRDIESNILLTKDILHSDRYMDGEHLTAEDENIVVGKLLAFHPHAEDKIGCGLDSIRQVMMRNTCNRLRRAFSTDAANAATEVESQPIEPFGKRLGIVHPAVFAHYIRNGKFPSFNSSVAFHIFEDQFKELKLDERLRNLGLLAKDSIEGKPEWLLKGSMGKACKPYGYISTIDFMWLYSRVPRIEREKIYRNMIQKGICVLEKCPGPTLKHPVIVFVWRAPPIGWYKLSIEVFVLKTPSGTTIVGGGGALRDSSANVVDTIWTVIPYLTNRDEMVLVSIYHIFVALILKKSRGMDVKKIILECPYKNVVNVLRRTKPVPQKYDRLYRLIFDMLAQFNKHEVVFQFPEGNGVANRLAYNVVNSVRDHFVLNRYPHAWRPNLYDRQYNRRVKDDREKRLYFHWP